MKVTLIQATTNPIETVKINDRFGRLVVIDSAPKSKTRHRQWVCKCECGVVKVVREDSLMHGRTRSCGCLHRESIKIAKEACTIHGESQTRLHGIWNGMLQRCENPKREKYPRYGGRGISVCAEWHEYTVFRDWAMKNGYADELTIDRIDNDGSYEPANCRWATAKEQANNRGKRRKTV